MLIRLYSTTFYERAISPVVPAAFAVVATAVEQTIRAAIFAIVLAVVLVIANMLTGVVASRREGKTITTKGLRKSVAKLLVYAATISAVLVVGVLLNGIETELKETGEFSIKGILIAIMMISVFICCIEIISVLQNMLRITPHVRLLEVLYNILTLRYIKKLPHGDIAFGRVDVDAIRRSADEKYNATLGRRRSRRKKPPTEDSGEVEF